MKADVVKAQSNDLLRYFNDGSFEVKKVKTAWRLAKEVAEAPFDVGVEAEKFMRSLLPQQFAEAVRRVDSHCIYFNPRTCRYYAASPSHHALLKQQTRSLWRWS